MTKKKKSSNIVGLTITFILVFVLAYAGFLLYYKFFYENQILKQVIEHLTADTRVAEVLVTDARFNSLSRKYMTTIKFLEYDSRGKALEPRYFTFSGNIIQFQSLVVRFDDINIEHGDALRGKSAYIFWKVFVLDGKHTQEYTITPFNEIPKGYKIDGPQTFLEQEIWGSFWDYALDMKKAKKMGIKNAQIEAPGTKFIPGMLYTIKIEHDGGLRIDAKEIPRILKGEKVAE